MGRKSSVVKSDQNFTATINLGKSLSSSQVSVGRITAHIGQGWTQVSLLRGLSMLAAAMATVTPATKLARLHA